MVRVWVPIMGSIVVLAIAGPAAAQPLGQFRWQQQPYCNLITLNVVQSGGVYQLDGFDDQCGGTAPRAAVVGTAFINPDGSVGMGLTVVTAPGATPVQINAALNPVSISGNWRDTSGTVGAFVLTPGAPAPGSPRPAPRSLFPLVSLGNSTISNVAAQVAGTDAANRGYVDGVAATKANTSDVSLVVPLVGAGSTSRGIVTGSVTMLDVGYDTRADLSVSASIADADECAIQRAADGSERRSCG